MDALKGQCESRKRKKHQPIAKIFKFAHAEVGGLPEFSHIGHERCFASFLSELPGKPAEIVGGLEGLRKNCVGTGVDIDPRPSHCGIQPLNSTGVRPAADEATRTP